MENLNNIEKIFITGGSGFIGYHFHQYLPEEKILNYDIQKPFFRTDAQYVEGDIRDTDRLINNLQGCDVILHLAATHFDFQSNYFETNVEGTSSLLEAVSEAGIERLIFFSSVAVYGKIEEPASEQYKPDPNIPYGESKLEAEKLIEKWIAADKNRSAVVIRPAVVYGAFNFGNVFNLIKQIDSGVFMNIGSGDNVKSIVYVKNLVNYTLQLMERMQPGINIYNATDEPHYSVQRLTGLISEKLEKGTSFKIPKPVAKLAAKPFDLLNTLTGKDWIISSERIEKFCADTHFLSENFKKDDIHQKFTPAEGLEKTIEWYESVDWKKHYEEWLTRVEKYA